MVVKANADVIPRGVVYTLRSVLRGSGILNAHFTASLYSPTWLFLCLFFLQGCGRPRWVGQADVSTHVFSFVVNRKVILVRMGEGGQLKMNELTTKE